VDQPSSGISLSEETHKSISKIRVPVLLIIDSIQTSFFIFAEMAAFLARKSLLALRTRQLVRFILLFYSILFFM